jgi:MOSC domain-containing protein YiiM
MASGVVGSINVSEGGVPKRPVPRAAIAPSGIEGDRQRDLRHHGGPERAVSLFASEVIDALRAEGHPIAPGTTGENLTVAGLPWTEIVPGAELRVGGARLRITSYVTPCKHVAGSFADGDFMRISQQRHPGWSRVYARVVEAGEVRVGDAVELVAPAR